MLELFEQEIKDGLSNCLANHSIAYTLDITSLKDETLADVKKWVATASIEQPDLFYMDSILATLGWNLNDDIFLKDEVFSARNTPVDKPFNKMHVQDDIIGHMTASRLLNSDYQVVEGQEFEHIAVSSVIYRAWRDDKKKEEIEKTIAQILEGKWKVSMECLFNKFDYGLITPEGKQIIVARTPETSYLTKYLRAYKGSGVINNNKIGRVLRNITFCGKGLVDDPGNPYSVIFNKSKKFFGAKASLKELRMNELEMAQAELAKIKAELTSAKAEAQKVAEAKLTAAIAERDEVIKTKNDAIAGLQTDINKLSETLSTTKANLETVESLKSEAVKALEDARAELNKIKTEAVVASRKAALAAIPSVAPERAESLLNKFASASDEMFNELVTTLAGLPPWMKKDEKKEGKTEAEMMEEKEKCKKEKEESDAKAAAEAKVVADLAKAELDKDIAGHSTASKTDDALNSIVNFMVSNSKYKSLDKGDK